MSYLDVPRLYFMGRFMARPATTNNSLDNYDPSIQLQVADSSKPGYSEWHPKGTGEFRLDCRITAAIDASYRDASNDRLIGGAVATNATESSPKIVDLDPEQENYSELYGMRVSIADPSGLALAAGLLDPPPAARDTWLRVYMHADTDGDRGAFFQSILTGIESYGQSSPVLESMLRAGDGRLSLKFVADNFGVGAIDPNKMYVTTDPLFATGRVVGMIGPARPGEPAGYLAARRLLPTAEKTPSFAPAPFTLNRERRMLSIDLSNAIPWTSKAGDPPAGEFFAGYRDASKRIVRLEAALDCSKAAYEKTAAVFDLDVTDAQATFLANRPLLIVRSGAAADVPVLAERPDGICVESEPVVVRLSAGETAIVEARARRFGVPLPGHEVVWNLESGNPWNNQPAAALSIGDPRPLVTGADGRALLHVTARALHDLPAQRKHIESQVYFLGGPWDGTHRGNAPGDMGFPVALSVLVFMDGPVIEKPVWSDVAPILQRYARLYPGMRAILDLADLGPVRVNRERMIEVLTLPISRPNYMPVTRDLPAFRRQTLLNWLNNGCPE